MSESRISRERTANLESYRDRLTTGPGEGTQKFLAKVTTGGTLPATAMTTFICNPISGVDVDETVSATPAYDVDTTGTIPVVFLEPPTLGDVVVAYSIGGRWVAERGGQQCCTWICPNNQNVPMYFDVVDPVYGMFRIPLVRSGSMCNYSLDTNIDYQGDGDCPAGMVPVHMQIVGGVFQLWIGGALANSATCGNPGGTPSQIQCMFTAPGSACLTDGTPNQNLSITCPTNYSVFPAPGGASVACSTSSLFAVSIPVTCANVTAGTFSLSASIFAVCQVEPSLSNPLYLLYGGCPVPASQGVNVTWNFTVGPTTPVGCFTASVCCQSTCGGCTLPHKDLQLAWTNSTDGNGTTDLFYTPSTGAWTSDCSNGMMFTLDCLSGQLELRAIYFTAGSCPDGTQAFCSNAKAAPLKLTLATTQCTPLSLTYTVAATDCPVVSASGYTQFVVTDPDPFPNPPGIMCQTICVTGCSFVGAGIDVSVSGDGGSASGTTDDTGCVFLSWAGTPGTYTTTAGGASITTVMACGGTTSIGRNGLQSECLDDTSDITCTLTYTYVLTSDGGVGQTFGPCTAEFTLTFDALTSTFTGAFTAPIGPVYGPGGGIVFGDLPCPPDDADNPFIVKWAFSVDPANCLLLITGADGTECFDANVCSATDGPMDFSEAVVLGCSNGGFAGITLTGTLTMTQ
jgi:hypothetical protein